MGVRDGMDVGEWSGKARRECQPLPRIIAFVFLDGSSEDHEVHLQCFPFF